MMDKLLERVRRLTHEQAFTDSATLSSQRGLQTQTVVDLFNEAHQTLHGILYDTANEVYIKTATQDITSGTATYTLPSDAFLGLNIISVEYKWGTGTGEYRKLQRKSIHTRDSDDTGDPYFYIQMNNQIILEPIPDASVTDGLRITYEFKQRTLDVRRGKITAFGGTSTAPTTLTLTDKSLADVALASNVVGTYITVVDKDGAVQMKDIPVASYDSGTGIVTLGSFTATAGEAVAADDYIVIGTNASTHSPFPDFCEPYLVEYVKRNILEMNGHPALPASQQKLAQLAQQIAINWSKWHSDIEIITEIDPDRYI